MGLRYKRCRCKPHVKKGPMRRQPRYLCKGCGLNFAHTSTPGKPLALKAAAVRLSISRLVHEPHRRAAMLHGLAGRWVVLRSWLA